MTNPGPQTTPPRSPQGAAAPPPPPEAGHDRLMDAVYRRQRHFYDATRKFYLLGRDRLISELAAAPGHTVLEVGCGTGRNLIKAARRYPEATFYGFDISEMMLDTAQANIRRAGLSEQITLAQGDASDFSVSALFGRDAVDHVFYSYTLSMIPRWRTALDQGVAALAPSGVLHAVDFGQQERLPAASRAVLRRWLTLFHVSPRAELFAALIDSAGRAPGRRVAFKSLYRGYTWLGAIR